MTEYRRWVFEANATREEFLRHVADALARRGYAVGPAKVYDLAVQGFGARGWVKALHHRSGIDLVLKEKGRLVGRTDLLETAVLEAGREAQRAVLPPVEEDAP